MGPDFINLMSKPFSAVARQWNLNNSHEIEDMLEGVAQLTLKNDLLYIVDKNGQVLIVKPYWYVVVDEFANVYVLGFDQIAQLYGEVYSGPRFPKEAKI